MAGLAYLARIHHHWPHRGCRRHHNRCALAVISALSPEADSDRSHVLCIINARIRIAHAESIILAKFELLTGFFHVDSMDERTALPVYLGIFVLAQSVLDWLLSTFAMTYELELSIFQIFMAWEAVYNRNVIQVRGAATFFHCQATG